MVLYTWLIFSHSCPSGPLNISNTEAVPGENINQRLPVCGYQQVVSSLQRRNDLAGWSCGRKKEQGMEATGFLAAAAVSGDTVMLCWATLRLASPGRRPLCGQR